MARSHFLASRLLILPLLLVVGCGGAPVVSPPDGGVAPVESGVPGRDDGSIEEARPPPPPPPPLPYPRPEYRRLSETGLSASPGGDRGQGEVAAGILAFEPTHKLWSDAAEKRRWVRLPPGTQIDTSEMDHWVFPVGTKLWKEFSRDGVLLETRLIERYDVGPDDYWMGAFVWSADQSDAVLAVDGQSDINGTSHDAPAQKICGACHRGDTGRVLGLSAIQTSRPQEAPGALTLRHLASLGLLSHPPGGGEDFPVPGDPLTVAALGYLHANCGSCHNQNGTAWPDTQMVLRLRVEERDAAGAELTRSVVGQPLQYWRGGVITLRVAPGDPTASAVLARMQTRLPKEQMPPLATELVDFEGVEIVRRWIAGLTP
jgi:hypothetical protein